MTSPRLEIDLDKILHNARSLVQRLARRGIGVTGVTKAVLGDPNIAAVMLEAGAVGLGDSRVANLARLQELPAILSLLRSPMPSQAKQVVATADLSFNTDLGVIRQLSAAAVKQRRMHHILLMVELGDLREGIMPDRVVETVREVRQLPNLVLEGIGANLACRSGVAPSADNMGILTALADVLDETFGGVLRIVSGGNSANLAWALNASSVGRINDLRLGEAILLGREPLGRTAIDGLHTDAFVLVAEVIESSIKPSQPWGDLGETAFGPSPVSSGGGDISQTIFAIGRQDVDPAGLIPPPGFSILGSSSDHLVTCSGSHRVRPGTEQPFQLNYSALLRAMTSPFVAKRFSPRRACRALPRVHQMDVAQDPQLGVRARNDR